MLGFKSRKKPGEGPHAAREPRVGHPCFTAPAHQYTTQQSAKNDVILDQCSVMAVKYGTAFEQT